MQRNRIIPILTASLAALAATASVASAASVTGTDSGERLVGTKAADSISALGGNDRVFALNGADVVSAGEGNDLVVGGRGDDAVSGDAGNDLLFANAGVDVLNGGDGDDRLWAVARVDVVAGADGAVDKVGDTLNGGAGNDRLNARDGEADAISCGEGTDVANLDNADVPWLAGDLYIEAGLRPLPPFKTVDTLKVLRRQFKSGAPFKSLDAFCQIAGIPAKTDKYDREAMERALLDMQQPPGDQLTLDAALKIVKGVGKPKRGGVNWQTVADDLDITPEEAAIVSTRSSPIPPARRFDQLPAAATIPPQEITGRRRDAVKGIVERLGFVPPTSQLRELLLAEGHEPAAATNDDEGGMSTALAGRARIDRAEPADGCLRNRCSSTH